MLLEVNELTKNFGGLSAVSNVSMKVNKGELIGLIGPNGAGKTTFFNLLTGVYEPTEGTVKLAVDGQLKNLNGLPPYKRTIHCFRLYSVRRNTMIQKQKCAKKRLNY